VRTSDQHLKTVSAQVERDGVTAVADDYGVTRQTVYNWMTAARTRGFSKWIPTRTTAGARQGGMPRWLLVAMLWADGHTMAQVALALSLSLETVKKHIGVAKWHLLGVGYDNGQRKTGHGTQLQVRAVLVKDGHLQEGAS
jgi:hypothetical protein